MVASAPLDVQAMGHTVVGLLLACLEHSGLVGTVARLRMMWSIFEKRQVQSQEAVCMR